MCILQHVLRSIYIKLWEHNLATLDLNFGQYLREDLFIIFMNFKSSKDSIKMKLEIK